MYKNNCFCFKTNAAAAAMANEKALFESYQPRLIPNQPPQGQLGENQAKLENSKCAGGAGNKIGRVTTGTIDENNKKIQCDECKHEDYFEWCWDKTKSLSSTSIFDETEHNILFNPGFSVGTGAVRGSKAFELGKHHFFEILMNTEVYGTDMMIGVGTDKVNCQQFSHSFVHFLGYDNESWGLSYSGDIYHGGHSKPYTKSFSQGTFVGIHLDLWSGTLEYYINRKPMGKAFTGLQNKILYPIIASTAARSGMNLTYCRSFRSTLQLQALLSLGQFSYCPQNVSIFNCHYLPPGLRAQIKKTYWWISSNARQTNIVIEENKENQRKFLSDASKSNAAIGGSGTTATTYSVSKSSRRKKFFFSTIGFGGESSTSSTSTSSTNATTTISTYHSTTGTANAADSESQSDSSEEQSSSNLHQNKRIRLRSLSLTNEDK